MVCVLVEAVPTPQLPQRTACAASLSLAVLTIILFIGAKPLVSGLGEGKEAGAKCRYSGKMQITQRINEKLEYFLVGYPHVPTEWLIDKQNACIFSSCDN